MCFLLFDKPLPYLEAEYLTVIRLDVELALQHGSPLFHGNAILGGRACDTIKEQFPSTTPRFSHIMFDINNFAHILNSKESEGEAKLDPLYYTEMLISLLYRLLDVAPLGIPWSISGEWPDDVAHLAMLAFMTTLLPEYGHDHSSYPLISDCLERAIRQTYSASPDIQDGGLSLLLWAMFISGISVLKREAHQWLLLKISETSNKLGLYDWPAVSRRICVFPWVHKLHGGPGQSLWEHSQR